MHLIAISLATFVAVSAASQIENGNAAFLNAGRHGCISALVSSGDINGAPIVSWDCNSNGDPTVPQDWDYTPFGYNQQLKILGNKCLDVKDGVDADGTKLQLWECDDQNPNQRWTHIAGMAEYLFQWYGKDKCIDLTDGSTDNGNPLQIWSCSSGNPNQRWFAYPGSFPSPGQGVRILAGIPATHGRDFMMVAPQNQVSVNVALVDATSSSPYPAGNGTWTMPALGTVGLIATFGGSKCLAVRSQVVSNGDPLQIVTCNGRDPTQLWRIGGFDRARSISWAGGNKCIDHGEQLSSNLPQIPVSDCDANNRGQWWLL